MALQLYNTLTRKKEEFVPFDPERVTVYVCGPTVYSYAHIGNARPAVVFDVLVRLLRHQWPNVVYARNITDIDDKITRAADEANTTIASISNRYTTIYRDNMESLGVFPPDVEPFATDHVPQMIEMCTRLISDGVAYVAEGHVLYHVPAFSKYGQLSGRNRDELIAGARVEVAPYKRDPADFVLWKPSTPDLPGWDSPWGRGRPGWHLECSCMIEEHLGRTIDIHGGGSDLIFPHHENEIAQSTMAHEGETFVRYWLHNGFVNVNQEKMAKSVGNVVIVDDLLEQHPGEAIRLALLNAHYRQPLDWTDSGLEQAKRMLDRLYGAVRVLGDETVTSVPDPRFLEALENDLNTPHALSVLFELARAAHGATDDAEKARIKGTLLSSGQLMGLLELDPNEWFTGVTGEDPESGNIEQLVIDRDEARKARRFEDADRIRDELAAKGILLDDTPNGTTWRRA